MSPLRISAALQSELGLLARDGYPDEACGVLLGTQVEGGRRVERLVRARNVEVERARHRYELAPEDFLAADRLARESGLDVIGVWHSHPDHPALPSESDRALAWEGWSYVIVSVTATGVQELRSWRLAGDAFREEECVS